VRLRPMCEKHTGFGRDGSASAWALLAPRRHQRPALILWKGRSGASPHQVRAAASIGYLAIGYWLLAIGYSKAVTALRVLRGRGGAGLLFLFLSRPNLYLLASGQAVRGIDNNSVV